ncbi:hypothetical protein E4T42_08108 [Aureobasidium subglaciale]|uniref:Uncharacterized protein n=1 Tax=Aureobasidium subglaciale (strain EXF-2481) TaxID=1043005 RepID=A0A074YLV4_AURSE|nr:uncharacterized protein AUEXF2481DRAFT_29797 [Aureobasidium subglaciale EXF-2481]KAI5211663.1 hypothetical protein E4T38_01234 [Aureobasidium subglaciale]KAI5230445.1 hypothetical protein E4T40_01235 [Aureobasidium subglaciale]KAI5233657.1 hypothetical protein E4T41_01233 [Aureobasidium subglaciale]KAI5241088.1 hypothetical protein E4T42_08108 [Aureobasidium subglaciale]KAI5267029.1 hypothetical protein E4T46_01233 [Aureobasidium subglaciale]
MPPPRLLSHVLPLFRYNRSTLQQQIRHQSTKPSAEATKHSRISRLEARLPRFLGRYVAPLRNAPISHITAFLILHELTAVIPLFGLTFVFHKFDWLPPFFSEGYYVKEGVAKFGRYFRRKGWIRDADGEGFEDEKNRKGFAKWWPKGEDGVRLLVEVATAYAITKALLPLRLGLSLWLTPNFAKISTLPIKKFFKRKVATTAPISKTAASPVVGTNAAGGKATK